MRYRVLSALGDSTFGSGSTAFFVNIPAAVAQAIQTRLLLMTNEWFLDVTEGTPYLIPNAANGGPIIGRGTTYKYDAAIKTRILGTQGVLEIVSYTSTLNRATRTVSVQCTVSTIYGFNISFSTGVGGSPVAPIIFDYAITDNNRPGVSDSGQIMTVD